ncbi:MAG: pyridoxamine 5'-phosphate oxidase family protein [Burkholderiales bacterium]|nr:pyridoxamine 5'-phosphate oxidase family protein [Burkholderiales bacterium]MDE1925721.1 pyridoxamine 5'-phosphate oxidase family protein [Burkholderiales bacterium]MDE2157860.1 pyridoxamine 5'-phosphate oxidase family protein [Burkholderiales bacterium]MDE2502557.1 pyridoxamine 5'-phosphate oxidase family protein [Burkholderiales bacterium]
MDASDGARLRRLLAERRVAALATLHRGEPAVSMVPYALPAGRTQLLIHVSALATHTRDLHEHARVGLLVVDAEGSASPLALARVALQAHATPLPRAGADYADARAHYLARFPDAATMFELGDFELVALEPVSARLVAGFGRAHSLVGDALAAWLRG